MLGGLQVVRQLSEGASAEVLLARAPDSGQRVIVEVIRPELFCESELRRRFLDEVQARRALEHPNVARRVREGVAADGRPFLVTEAVGDTLGDWLRARGPLDVETLIKLAIPLCEALHYLHLRGVVHGNLKPAAVHLGADGMSHRPKLVDYGLALFRPGRTMPRPPGRVLVEAEYLAPERIRGQRGSAASDVYALGVLMYEALTGAPPFCGDPIDVRRGHLCVAPEPLPSHCARLAPILARCLAKDASSRFESALQVRDALAKELEGTLPLPPPAGSSFGEARPQTGDSVGPYTLVEPIGEGAMGRVFLARHAQLGRLVALKLLKPEHAHDTDQVERFVREARAVNRIRDEHIVEIFDLVDEATAHGGRRVYCVMELLRGANLGELLARGPLPLLRTLKVLRQVAGALDAAHRAGVIHRDIKPDNIFVTEREGEDFAKVVDFGVAKLRDSVEPAVPPGGLPPSSWSQTAAGTVVGTPAFMSPEQALGKQVDHRADVYGLGSVLYRAVAGTNPFSAADFEALSACIATAPPPPLPDVAPLGEPLPPGLRALIGDCLQKEPGLRPQTMGEVAARLEAVIARMPAAPIPLAEAAGAADRVAHGFWRSRHSWMVAAVGSGALLLAALYLAGSFAPAQREGEVVTTRSQEGSASLLVTLTLESEPSGAQVVRMDTGETIGVTPLVARIARADGVLPLRFELPDRGPAQVSVPLNADASVRAKLPQQ